MGFWTATLNGKSISSFEKETLQELVEVMASYHCKRSHALELDRITYVYADRMSERNLPDTLVQKIEDYVNSCFYESETNAYWTAEHIRQERTY